MIKPILSGLILVACFQASAKGLVKAETDAKYQTKDGAELSVLDATVASLKGEQIFKCQEVEATSSKSGSISLKAKK